MFLDIDIEAGDEIMNVIIPPDENVKRVIYFWIGVMAIFIVFVLKVRKLI